jgi:hypothetical protein
VLFVLDRLGFMPDDGCMAGMKKGMAGFWMVKLLENWRTDQVVVVGGAAVRGGKAILSQ